MSESFAFPMSEVARLSWASREFTWLILNVVSGTISVVTEL